MKPKKILLTGVSGQVGHALSSALSSFQWVGLDRQSLNLGNLAEIRRVICDIQPDLIINPAAYTAVDKAESESELANVINRDAPKVIAEEAAKNGAALIHFSTDYVYDGTKELAYLETDLENPTSVYGESKLAGEKAIASVGLPHLILRTSWVYGAYGKNFLKTILRLAENQTTLKIVSDQFGAPTNSVDIARATYGLINQWNPQEAEQTGIYHLTNSGRTSWHGFAQAIVDQYDLLSKKPVLKASAKDILAITTSQYPTAAKRPQNSCLNNQKLKDIFDVKLPSWERGLEEVMRHL